MSCRVWSLLPTFCFVVLVGCAPPRYFVQIHSQESSGNHYVVIEENDGKMYDCYSKPDGLKWCPICREVITQESSTWIKADTTVKQ